MDPTSFSLSQRLARQFRSCLLGTLTVSSIANAGTTNDAASGKLAKAVGPTIAESLSLGERLENLGRVYNNSENPILQTLWILGRYHGQYHWSDGSNGQDDGYESRRVRIGAQAHLFNYLTLHAQAISGSDFEPTYNGFTELWARWAFNDAIQLTIGQQKHRFSHDRNVSSRYIQTLERSALINMFGADYTPAVTLSGRTGHIDYYAGIFSNAAGTDMWESFTELDSGYSLLAAVYYDLGKKLGTDSAFLHASYVHSDANENATNLNRYTDGFSAALILTQGAASFMAEGIVGLGVEKGDACGINLQPGYFITEKLQIVGRYQLASSNGDNGIQAQRRYERNAGLSTGDLYQAGYVGLNYHIAKHRIKVMTGIEYSTLGGEEVWTASTMFRMFWGPQSGGAFPMNVVLSSNPKTVGWSQSKPSP
jgi:phosphate-selective porin OprO and OprP